MMRLLSILFLAFALIIGVSFGVMNSDKVIVHYYLGAANVHLSALMLGVWIFGIVVGLLATFPKYLKLKLELRRLRRERD